MLLLMYHFLFLVIFLYSYASRAKYEDSYLHPRDSSFDQIQAPFAFPVYFGKAPVGLSNLFGNGREGRDLAPT